MKNIYIIITISLFTAIACNDSYLEKYPLDQINDASFWKTSSDLEMYANQFYPSLKDPNYIWRLDNPTDNNGPASRDVFTWGLYTIPVTGGGWGKADWLGIRSCDYALDRIPAMTQSASVSQNEAEIRFFRAFYYSLKVKQFGEVPWLEHDLTTESEDLLRPRDSRNVVATNMLKDLDFAIKYLPAVSTADRLTKYAALALKADFCLYEGTFRKSRNLGDDEPMLREAVSACEGIINSGLFSLYSTGKPNNDYFDLFIQYELKGNKEGIMIQRFLESKRMHNNVRQLGEANTGYTKDFVQSYLCTDGLPIGLSPLYKGDAVFGDEFKNRDPRMQQSVYNSDRIYRIYDNGDLYYRPMPEFDPATVTTSYYIIKGYSPYERDRQQLQTILDDFIYRYGVILVTYAEAKAELGECTQAVLDQSINLLRKRVGMPDLTVAVGFVDPNWPNWEVAVTPLINEIRRERRIETCGEGSRWNDLVRWKAGKLLENPLTVQGARDPETGSYHILYPGFTTKVWNDKLYLYPIPTQEIVLNSKLTQNPGW